MLTRKEFEIIQKNTGFNIELLEKVYHLTRVLNEIQKHPILKENITLKGGTALNFIYLNIQRLSIDLDFDYTGKITKEEMVKQRPQLEKEIKEIASKLEYRLKDRGSSYIISRQSLQYQTIRNTKDHIKIEINYLDRMPLGNKEIKEFPSIFTDISPFPDVVNKFFYYEYSKDTYENTLYQYLFFHSFMIGWRVPSEIIEMTVDDVIIDSSGRGCITITETKKHRQKRTILPEKSILSSRVHKSFKNWIDKWRPKVENQYSGNALYLQPSGKPFEINHFRGKLSRFGKKIWQPISTI